MEIPERIQILLIEDSDDDAYLISEALEDEPYRITRISDGQHAYTHLLTTHQPPDVVLMDYRLPGMNGLEIIQELDSQGKEYGYIVLTVDMQIDTAIEVMKAGASDFLPKAKGYDFLPDMIRKVYRIQKDRQEKQRMELALRKNEEQFRMLFEYAPLAMVIVRPDASCLVNAYFTNFLGYAQEDIASLSAAELASLISHPDDFSVEYELAQNIFAGKSDHYRLEKRYIKKDGGVVWGDLTTVLLPSEASETVLALSMVQDITHRKQAEEELKQARRLAEAANVAKSEFLANMSHELRTPLNAILGYAQILKRDRQLTQSQQHGLNVIERSGEYLLTLINDILDLSKIEARKLELHPTALAFPEFLYGVSEMIRIRAQQKNLSFSAENSPILPAMIQADEQRLSQILLNLLNNAVKFTDRGKVILRVTATFPPSPEPVEGVCHIRFEVEDTGIGIPEQKTQHLFSPFTQFMEQGRRAQGTGLGLAISQQLAQLMGGSILVESTPEKGSLFWFEADFPVATAPPQNSYSQTPQIRGFQGECQALIVDDQAENRMVLQQMLASLGFQVEDAVNGREALAYIRNNRPDVIFMDLMMDDLDGFEVTRRLRQDAGA